MEKKTKRLLIDWDSVEPLFRLGALSNCAICRQYEADHKNSQTWKPTVAESAIRKQAKAKGWKKNLAGKVQKEIKERLVRFGMRDTGQCAPNLSDKEIIDQAAEIGSNVLLRHRIEIKALLELEEAFLIELGGTPQRGQFASFQGDISSIEVDLTLPEKVKTLKDLAAVRAQRIALERQAFNIKDDTEPDNGTGEDRVWTIKGVRAKGPTE